MSGIFSTFNTANKGLQSSQINIDTTSHNIANANTEGYSRQRVQLEAANPFNKPGIGQIGTGVDIGLITRVRDKFLDGVIRSEQSIEGKNTAKSDVLNQVETLFLEPGETGLSSVMGKMWNAWQELSKNPNDSTLKNILSQASQSFTNTVNHIEKGFETLKANVNEVIDGKINTIESIVNKVDSLNTQISKALENKQKPNDLMDKRDLLLDDLSKIIEFKYDETPEGKINIKIGGTTLTDSSINVKDTVNNLLNSEDYKTLNGELIGYKTAISEIEGTQGKLDNLVKEVATKVNEIHGESFFVNDGEFTAGSIRVNPTIVDNPEEIEGSYTADGTSKALQIAKLRNENTMDNGGNPITFDHYYRNVISDVGISANEAKTIANNQGELLHQLNLKKDSVSGVSMDEEIANLVKYQHSYQANSKVISTLTQMLDTIINRMGV